MPTEPEPDPNRRQLSLHLPAAVERALRAQAAKDDLPLSRVALRYVRDGLREDGHFPPEAK